MTGCIHIIALFVTLIALLAAALIIWIQSKESKLKQEKDFIQIFIENRQEILRKCVTSLYVSQYFSLILISSLLCGTASYLLSGNAILAVILAAFGAFLPDIWIRLTIQKRNRKFNENFAKALEQLASSLKAGLSIPLAVKDVVNSPFIDERLRKQFAQISSDLEMGRTVQEAFTRFADEVNNPYADDVALSIDIQDETGGHESEVIKDIADGIRERIMLEREIKSIFNETVLTIRVIQLVTPFTMIGMLFLLPSYKTIYLSGGVFTAVFILLMGLELAGMILDRRMIDKAKRGR